MTAFAVTLSLPLINNGPTFYLTVEAADRDDAMDAAFEKAFADYPQYGGFQIDDIEEAA